MKTTTLAMAALFVFGMAKAQNNLYSANESNGFALRIYKQLAQEDDNNIFFSPISINLALGMTYAGAAGETKNQIANVFGFPLDDISFHKNLGSLQNSLIDKKSVGVKISLANQQWADKNYRFKCSYTKLVKRSYNAPVKRLDFYLKPNDGRLEINRWVESQTNDLIKDLLPEGSISNLTKLVLTNAIYFKGKWDKEFEEENTQDDVFTTISGQEVKCKMMNALDKFNIYQGEDLKLLELPYAGLEFSMLVLLPNEESSLKEIEKTLHHEKLNHYTDLMIETDVRLMLPKFKFEAKYQLKPILTTMGMPIAFSNEADFSGMSKKRDLKIDEIFHKAFVDVSEEGTEAAAATAVVIVRKAISIPVEFNANRPFLFIIREKATGFILFMGRVTNPNS